MSFYVLGRLVSRQNHKFLNIYLNDPVKNWTRLEQAKEFKTLRITAQRNKTSLQSALTIVQNNRIFARKLNNQATAQRTYVVDRDGELCQMFTDKTGNRFVKKLSTEEQKFLINGKTAPVTQNKSEQGFWGKFRQKAKYLFEYTKSLFNVYS